MPETGIFGQPNYIMTTQEAIKENPRQVREKPPLLCAGCLEPMPVTAKDDEALCENCQCEEDEIVLAQSFDVA